MLWLTLTPLQPPIPLRYNLSLSSAIWFKILFIFVWNTIVGTSQHSLLLAGPLLPLVSWAICPEYVTPKPCPKSLQFPLPALRSYTGYLSSVTSVQNTFPKTDCGVGARTRVMGLAEQSLNYQSINPRYVPGANFFFCFKLSYREEMQMPGVHS